jgi:hypothetical protein
MEFIFNPASIVLQYHMHGFIGSAFFIRIKYNDGAIFLRSTYTMVENSTKNTNSFIGQYELSLHVHDVDLLPQKKYLS